MFYHLFLLFVCLIFRLTMTYLKRYFASVADSFSKYCRVPVHWRLAVLVNIISDIFMEAVIQTKIWKIYDFKVFMKVWQNQTNTLISHRLKTNCSCVLTIWIFINWPRDGLSHTIWTTSAFSPGPSYLPHMTGNSPFTWSLPK